MEIENRGSSSLKHPGALRRAPDSARFFLRFPVDELHHPARSFIRGSSSLERPQGKASMVVDGFCYDSDMNYLGDCDSSIKTRASHSYRGEVQRDLRTEARDEAEGTNGIEPYFPNTPAWIALERTSYALAVDHCTAGLFYQNASCPQA
ncbi:hypothetical protein VNO77_19163 [Canavalia gladiata]|uniref:Uncharacterized protein n=1 Tax=Canavalia gladiata TaxID=3824 RepID=A0AAN9LM81_CANGL